MVDRFPVVLRGYDKEKVDAAFEVAQDSVNEAHRTLANMREQIAADDDRILQLQAQLQEERNKKSQGNTFASLGANAQQMLASAEQTSSELLERAKQDASSTRMTAQAQAETLINNAKLDAQHIVMMPMPRLLPSCRMPTIRLNQSPLPPTRMPPSCALRPPRTSPSSVRPLNLSSATPVRNTIRSLPPNALRKSAKSPR